MIRSAEESREGSDSAVVAEIAAQLRESGGSVWDDDSYRVREVARAVEQYVTDDQGSESVDSRSLTLLTSQALDSLGEVGTARRLLVFGSGLLKPSEWEIRRGTEMWILDARQFAAEPGAKLELVLFAALAAVLRSIAELWDDTSGSGALGLRHVAVVAASVLGRETAREKRVAAMAAEIAAWCRRVMERLRSERGWSDTPEILNLDMV